jgi:hypothetical protein
MLPGIRLFVITVALLAMSPLADAAQGTSISGWRNYKFGMTPKQARSVPGVKWKPLKITDVVIVEVGTMEATTPVYVFGSSLKLELVFDPDKLNGIKLSNKTSATSRSECVDSYEALLLDVEKEYGIFAPPQRDDVPGESVIRGAPVESVIEAGKQLRNGSSRYLLSSSDGLFFAGAEITLGSKIRVHMSYQPTAATGCERFIEVNPS